MKVSESWLREWVNPAIDTAQLVAQVTMAGLEVDGVEPVAGVFSGVIVGEILSAEQHPDAEKLRICRVKGHPDGVMQVVCGAANARAGIRIPFAIVGAELPGNMTIKKAKLRGVESFGMLCGQTELLAGDDDRGLWELPGDAPVGKDLRDYLQLDDSILALDLTPNRGDCLSIRGFAREIGVLNQVDVKELVIPATPVSSNIRLSVMLSAPEACPIYVGRAITGIDIQQPSPPWLVEKLRRSGIRSIDAVVDVTNYVLLELGQPMHAFDLRKIKGDIHVRFAKSSEKLRLLNQQDLVLREDTLVIADDVNALAVAGIMGGEASAVGTDTCDIFLESAYFSPLAVAGKARSYGLHTDSSHRFERGVDCELQVMAVERATQLLLDIVGGHVGPLVFAESADHKPKSKTVKLTKQRLENGLGLTAGQVDVKSILQRLGLIVLEENDQGWIFGIPSFRFDIAIEEDLLEEIARIYGYDRLPTRPMIFSTQLESHSEAHTSVVSLKRSLVVRGFQEVITYSFIDPKLHDAIIGGDAIELKNPISADMAKMRTSLVPGLVQTLLHNLNRQHTRAKLFEVGMVFKPQGDRISDVIQQSYVAGLIYGDALNSSWSTGSREADFFDLKGDVEAMLAQSVRGREVTFVSSTHYSYLHPGQAAEIFVDGALVGYIGTLHPNTGKALGLNKPLFVFEAQLLGVLSGELPRFAPLSRQPEVNRDLAVVVDKRALVADLERNIRKTAGIALKELKLFDVYSGEGIDPQRKSLAFSLTFQDPSRTLTDDEVNVSMAAVLKGLEDELGAILR